MSSIAFLPVSQTQKNAFNYKELSKLVSAFIEQTTKSIVSLPQEEITEEKISELIKNSIESVYKVEESSSASSAKQPKAKRAKQAFTSYIYFCKEQRSVIKEENPESNPTEITTLLAEKWNSLSDEEKQPYVDMHNEEAEQLKKQRESGEEPEEEAPKPKVVKKAAEPVVKAPAPKAPAPKAPATKAPAPKAPAPKAPSVTVEDDDDEPILQPSTDKKVKGKK